MNQTLSVDRLVESSLGEKPWVEVYGSRGLPDWLRQHALGLAFSTYQTGKLFLIGAQGDKLSVFERTFDRAMGLYGNSQTLWLGTRYQLWRFENMLRPGRSMRGTTSSTSRASATPPATSISTISPSKTRAASSSRPPPATAWPRSAWSAVFSRCGCLRSSAGWPCEDRCHLNGLALRDGKARYVTAISRATSWTARATGGPPAVA